LYGPGGEMPGSSRTHKWYWSCKLFNAELAYTREFLRREEWRKKLEAKGVSLSPEEANETLPQYLRRRADELEAKPADIRVGWGVSKKVDWKNCPQHKKQ